MEASVTAECSSGLMAGSHGEREDVGIITHDPELDAQWTRGMTGQQDSARDIVEQKLADSSSNVKQQVIESTVGGSLSDRHKSCEATLMSRDANLPLSSSDCLSDPVNDETPAKLIPEQSQMNSSTTEAVSRAGMTLDLSSGSPGRSPVTSPIRFNPFNKRDVEEQDPFPQLQEATEVDMSSEKTWSDEEETEQVRTDPVSAELGITEDHFSQPKDHIGISSVDELESAISECKRRVLEAEQDSDLKKDLVHQLVQLRLKLAEAHEKPTSPEDGVKATVGHMFVLKNSRRTQRYCEQCNTVIWGVLQAWYRCNSCGFCCHEKCLDCVTRTCANTKVLESPEYVLSICPEKTLSSQNYKCADCRASISFHSSVGEPRLCDYNGQWYCDRCHWNDQMTIPARILHNWDFEPRKVCRGSKQFLKLMRSKAVLRVVDVNPMLFNFVEELNDVKKLREEILVMKQYFLSCRGALQSKLLLQLKSRQHFVENSDMYSVHDLLDVANDLLLPELAKIHASFAQHIKTDCLFCQAKGNVCDLCDEKEVLFPFDNIAIVCSRCSTVLHRHCYMSSNQRCPKCDPTSARND